MPDSILRVEKLRTYFFTYAGIVKAVDDISLDVSKGETLGVEGESGSGKTVTAQSILRIVPSPGKIVDGTIEFEGKRLPMSRRILRPHLTPFTGWGNSYPK